MKISMCKLILGLAVGLLLLMLLLATDSSVSKDVTKAKIPPQFTGTTEQEKWRNFHLHHLYDLDQRHHDIPHPSQSIPRILHIVWCKKGPFLFSHFLSVLSAIKAMRPDAMYFYYHKYPTVGKWMYNTWLEELRYNFPWFLQQKSDASEQCHNDQPRTEFILSKLKTIGGLYLALDTLLINFEQDIMNFEAAWGMYQAGATDHYAIVAAKQGLPLKNTTYSDDVKSKRFKCMEGTIKSKTGIEGKPCLTLQNDSLVLKDFLVQDTSNLSIAMFIRELLYGNRTISKLEPQDTEVVPNVAHFVWFGGGKMDYVFYLSVLSVLYIVKVDRVYIHGEQPPAGQYWKKLEISESKNVHWIYRPRPHLIFAAKVGRVEHAADVARHDIMLKYGGLHVDTDAIFNRTIDRQLFHYDTVVTLDSYLYPMPPFPDVFNLGVVLTRPYSKFWQLYQLSECYYYEGDYTWNSNRVPYKIWERNPQLLHIEPDLQLICCDLKCYPTWVKTRKEAVKMAKNPESWIGRPMAFHWTAPTPPEMANEAVMRGSKTLFATIGHNVLKAAGLW